MKQEDILISVIVTAYNIEGYLPRCVDSLLAQTYGRLEIILVDDGSTDGTPKLCDDYEKKNGNVRALHRKNGGPSAARNTGLAIARGDYIGYVDGDDWTEPDMYRAMLSACLEEGAQIAICAYRQVGKGARQEQTTGRRIRLDRDQALEVYISDDQPFHIYHSVWSKLFERRTIEGIRFPEGRRSEDIMYTTWALTKASMCVFLDTPYYNYTVDRSTSIMNSRLHERRFQDEIPFWKEQAEYLRGIGMEDLAEKALYQFYRKMLFYYVDFRDRGMKESGRKLISFLREEQGQIRRVYQREFAVTGDRVRMRLALRLPGTYYRVSKLYDKFIIPLRQQKGG